MSWLNSLRSVVHRRRRQRALEQTYARLARFTMVPRDVFLDNLRLAEQVTTLPGSVVECGVWRGGMIAGLVGVLGSDRDYYLLDSFEGLPNAAEIDGPAALAWQRNPAGPNYHDNCTAEPDFAAQAMHLAGAKSVTLVKGWFADTVPSFVPRQPIALLRLDGDWYESTMTCLEGLFDRVTPGGLIVLDDYYTWDGCARALHDFLSARKATERISSYNGICFLRKAAAPAQ